MNSMYIPHEDEKKVFGRHWCGPEEYLPWEKVLVARYPKLEGGDGQDVEIYCVAVPARFYSIRVLAGENSVKTYLPAYKIETGSGASTVAALLGKEISRGMLQFSQS